MDANRFIEVFVEIFKVNASVAIIFFCGLVLFKTQKQDRNLLRARLFLNDAVMQQSWIYISIAGVSFAFNVLFMLAGWFRAIGDMLVKYYIIELNQIIFLTAFVFAVHNWYQFITTHGELNAVIQANDNRFASS